MMIITDRINETIEEIATERKIDEHSVSWHNIAIRLAEKLNQVENLAIHNVSQQRELLSRFLVQYNQDKLTTSDEMDIDLFLNDNKPT